MARRMRMRSRRGRKGGMGGAVLGMVVMLGLLLMFLYFCSVSFSCGRGGVHEGIDPDVWFGTTQPVTKAQKLKQEYTRLCSQYSRLCWKLQPNYMRDSDSPPTPTGRTSTGFVRRGSEWEEVNSQLSHIGRRMMDIETEYQRLTGMTLIRCSMYPCPW